MKIYRQKNPISWDDSLQCFRVGLTQGKEALVDLDDIVKVQCVKWRATNDRGKWYVGGHGKRVDGTLFMLSLHQLIAKPSVGSLVDHINGDPLDNRRANLRICNHTGNAQNAKKTTKKKTSSVYKGVNYITDPRYTERKWLARVQVEGKRKSLGHFATEIEAARAYDSAAKKYHGEFANLNFPEED